MELPKVLYVDDEEMNLLLFQLNFKKHFEVVTASRALQGLDLLKGGLLVDIVISDMKMPGMSGLEFLSEARAILKDQPFYILTGFEIIDEIKAALKDGLIQGYFQKPFNREMLLNEFQFALNTSAKDE